MTRLAFALTLLATAPAYANDAIFFSSVPTLDEIGLGGLIAAVAAAAGWALRHRHRR